MNGALPLRLKPLPISRDEFARAFRKCVPPVGWSKKIAVANSGGVDSTCVLFLIDRLIRDIREEHTTRSAPVEAPENLPSELISMTVDHGLQDGSETVAKQCAERAEARGIPHITTTVPWSTPPFPDRPRPGDAFEEIGRNVRYQLLFRAMRKAGADILALGHHSDDQVETSLIRLARGTTELGAGGMRRCRRWGMGSNGPEHSLSWTGSEGMHKWMLRPLLEFPKDRLLATCEENNLEYVTDETNFQPQLTLRNAIRALMAKNTFDPEALGVDLPPNILTSLKEIHRGVAALESVDMDLTGGPEDLRAAVTVLSEQVEDVDSLVDSALTRCHLPSPPGTYLLSYRGISTVRDPLVQRALVLRIMRYVSFHPWGTVRADGNRRRSSIERIIENLWTPDPFAKRLPPFVAGGGVFWTPVIFSTDHPLRIPSGAAVVGPGEIVAWLASRQPPLSRSNMSHVGLPNPLRVDATERVRAALLRRDEEPAQVLHVLWDCRFEVKMFIDLIPDRLAERILDGRDKVMIHPNTRWYWPKVVHCNQETGREEVLHSMLMRPDGHAKQAMQLDFGMGATWPWVRIPQIKADWIRLRWIRSASAL